MIVLFLLFASVLVLTGLRVHHAVLNPLTCFAGIWLVITCLYQLRLSGLQGELSEGVYIALIVVMASFGMFYFIAWTLVKKDRSSIGMPALCNEEGKENGLAKITYFLFGLWIAGALVEVVYSGGVPFYWKIVGSTKTYFDFGIPSIHGLLNATGIFTATIAWYAAMKRPEFKVSAIAITAAELSYYLMIISRQVIMSMLLQIALVVIIERGRKIHFGKTALAAIAAIFFFGMIGNFRTGFETFLSVSYLPSDLPIWASGFYWIYMYLCMTLANVNNLLACVFEPLGLGYLFQDFIPSVLSSILSLRQVDGLSFLVSIQFNVSGFFAHYFEAFGWIGLAIAGASYGLLGGASYALYRTRKNTLSVVIFVIALHIIALSFFTDLLLYLPVSFEFILAAVFLNGRVLSRAPKRKLVFWP